MMLAAGPPAVALAGCLANGTTLVVIVSPRWRLTPAALEIACWSCLRVAAGTLGSTTRATSRRVAAPRAALVWGTALPAPHFVSFLGLWGVGVPAPPPPAPPGAGGV